MNAAALICGIGFCLCVLIVAFAIHPALGLGLLFLVGFGAFLTISDLKNRNQ